MPKRRRKGRLRSVRAGVRKAGARRRGRKPEAVERIECAEYPVVSVVVPVMNERATIGRVIREAASVHPSSEVIVVVNGSGDGSAETAKRMGARVLEYDQPLGHDVGRAIGAAAAKGSVILFTDADIVLKRSELKPFADAVLNGVDVALNRYLGPVQIRNVHNVILSKHALNWLLARPDLKGTSMTTVPHAISRRALELIGAEALAVPPKAQAAALINGLRVDAVHYVEVGARNRTRRRNHRGKDPVERLIVGDHLEAVDFWTRHLGTRGLYSDGNRIRNAEERSMPSGGEST